MCSSQKQCIREYVLLLESVAKMHSGVVTATTKHRILLIALSLVIIDLIFTILVT